MATQGEIKTEGGGLGNIQAPALVLEDGIWHSRDINVLDTSSLPTTCYIFMTRNSFPCPKECERECERISLESSPKQREREKMREQILKPYRVPEILRTDSAADMNGYFGSASLYNTQKQLDSHNTWFRCLTKIILTPNEAKQGEKDYKWYEMGFFTQWERSGPHRVLCVDTPLHFKSAFLATMAHSTLDMNDPFAMLKPLIDELVNLYDRSVWRVRDTIRVIERNRLKVKPDFHRMQEIMRHAIHVKEVLTVFLDMLEKLHQDKNQVYDKLNTQAESYQWEQAQSHLQLQIHLARNLKERSLATVERLQSEITLAYNIITQEDNSVMKLIAVLGMTFLPGTFVSAYFSTNFFTYGDGWGGTSKMWVYWVVTIPSTVAIILIFQAWVRTSNPGSTMAGSWRRLLRMDRTHPVYKDVPVV